MLKIKTKNSEDSLGIGIESTAGVTSVMIQQKKQEEDSDDHSHDFDNCKHSDNENISSPEASPSRKVINDSTTVNVHLRP